MVFRPQEMSSASFATTPSSGRSPNARHKSSSSAVSEPGVPIAHRAYARTPRVPMSRLSTIRPLNVNVLLSRVSAILVSPKWITVTIRRLGELTVTIFLSRNLTCVL